jgi:hypothetical protein
MKKSKQNENENILETCFFCNTPYLRDDFLVLDEQDQKSTLHVTCAKCNTSILIFSSVAGIGVVNLGITTDLDKKEAKRLFQNKVVSTDDVLELHKFIYNQNSK